MAHYKIKNITGKLPKRHVNKDTILNIEYQVGFHKKFKKLNFNDEIVLSCRRLPISIHGLRAKQLITVTEISENEFMRLQKPSARKIPIALPVKKEVVAKEPVKKKTTPKKTAAKKESTVTIKED
jgi:hypothetical protein